MTLILTREQAEFVAQFLRLSETYEVHSEMPKYDSILTKYARQQFTDIADSIEQQLSAKESLLDGITDECYLHDANEQ